MARVTVEDCLANVENRFELVLLATKRTRELCLGKDAMVDWEKDKATVVALREIAEGLITKERYNKNKPFTPASKIVSERAPKHAADEELPEEE